MTMDWKNELTGLGLKSWHEDKFLRLLFFNSMLLKRRSSNAYKIFEGIEKEADDKQSKVGEITTKHENAALPKEAQVILYRELLEVVKDAGASEAVIDDCQRFIARIEQEAAAQKGEAKPETFEDLFIHPGTPGIAMEAIRECGILDKSGKCRQPGAVVVVWLVFRELGRVRDDEIDAYTACEIIARKLETSVSRSTISHLVGLTKKDREVERDMYLGGLYNKLKNEFIRRLSSAQKDWASMGRLGK